MTYPLVLDLAAAGIAVAVTCRVLGFSKQAFYAWRKSPVKQRDWDDAHLINAGENRVARLCSQQQIWSVFAKKRGLNRKSGPPVHDDLVDRQFTAAQPNL